MKKIVINKTTNTPFIVLERGLLHFSGSSIPSDAKKFFKPVILWIKKYKVEEGSKIVVNFSFDYLDTASSKYVFDILKILDKINSGGNQVTINWYYEEGDEDMLDMGIYLKSMIKSSFNFIENEQSIDEVKVYMATV